MSFFLLGAEQQLKDSQLMKLKALIDWKKIGDQLKGLYKRDDTSGGGPIPYDSLSMFKAVLLGQWHNLSDPKLEESLKVRLDFMLFTGFELGRELPDETTLCRFRNRLINADLLDTLLRLINRQLESKHVKIKAAQGAVIDATVIESAARPNRYIEGEVTNDRQEPEVSTLPITKESVDPDAKWLKKGKRSYFGYKGFIRTDAKDGYIEAVHTTPANQAEVNELTSLTQGMAKRSRLYADKAYASQSNRYHLKQHQLRNGIMAKAYRNRPLTHRAKQRNKALSKIRYIVEQAFGTLKRRFDMARSRYLGIAKVHGQLLLKAMCFNLLKAVNRVQMG
jgi:IS5 family transposase